MRYASTLLAILLLGAPDAGARDAQRSGQPSGRDRAVLEVVAAYLLAADDFAPPFAPKLKQLVLAANLPEEARPFLCFENCGADSRLFSRSEISALSRRNASRRQPDWRSICSPCSDTIGVVPDLEEALLRATDPSRGADRKTELWWSTTFSRAFPAAKGWIWPFLPGYSADGSEAVFLAWTGPYPHPSIVRAHLHLVGGVWVLDWCDIVRYM